MTEEVKEKGEKTTHYKNLLPDAEFAGIEMQCSSIGYNAEKP